MTATQAAQVAHSIRSRAEAEGLVLDDAQLAVLPALSAAAAAALSLDPAPGSASLYLWGPPGRGKTWLLDALYDGVDVPEKRRLHFHDFFRELHERVFQGYGAPGYRKDSAFAAALEQMLGSVRLLCFDEFHVNDPADAAFITRMLRTVLDRGIVLAATSNYAPQELLPDPMFHHLFEPGIAMITDQLQVLALDGNVDYRDRPRDGAKAGFAAGHHLRQANPESLAWAGLVPPAHGESVTLTPGSRALRALRAASGQLWFDFEDLCHAQSATSDYLQLSRTYPHWVISSVPSTAGSNPYGWQRFGNVVDVLYDGGCRLDVIGLPDYSGVFPGTAHPTDLARIRSRFGMLQRKPTDAD
ncbi:cell division protein ZapE [Arthrobacter zhangbolii]|uniref:Cell division protein ZapE n=1 Tax=Arthrobacter zhangbolii TaxID=2886936 RepID=A0A9X1M8J1_9MICC|nr:cell division protein ZapE [Arthrobacter zhangbolii]MCC3273438.1 cell division protein ZapE [Arthrobacter zhangbolii]MCC3296029.1 cell division protein ZapE [Arthrobacter zhangbolii]UON92588.1 cell division protein ZapE [Arthrobacter zhangbolii]